MLQALKIVIKLRAIFIPLCNSLKKCNRKISISFYKRNIMHTQLRAKMNIKTENIKTIYQELIYRFKKKIRKSKF